MTFHGDLVGEARSQPGVGKGQRDRSDDGDTRWGVVAGRTLSVECRLLRVSDLLAPEPVQKILRSTCLRAVQGAQVPQSGFLKRAAGRGEAAGVSVKVLALSQNKVLHLPTLFSHRVVRDLNCVASSRFMSSTTPCANKLSSAVSVASASACLSTSPPALGNRPKCLPQRRSKIRFSSVSQFPVSLLIKAFASKSSAHHYFSAGVVVIACRLHQRSLSCLCVRQVHLGPVASVRSRICAPQLLRFDNCRILGLASETTPPCNKRPFWIRITLHGI